LGHAAIAVTGSGIYSYGTPEPFGSSVTDYLTNQADYRNDIVVILPTTPDQESAIIQAMNSYGGTPYSAVDHNCATAVTDALGRAGIVDQTPYNPNGPPAAPNLPSSLLMLALQQPGAQLIVIPQGGTVPASLSEFNPSH
jgi:hypothetical protein